MPTQRKTGGRGELDAAWTQLNAAVADLAAQRAFQYRFEHSALAYPDIGNGGTAGRLRTQAAITTRINGTMATKASTDDLWNLSAETDTIADQYRAYWLYLDASGTASIGAGANAATSAAAVAALPEVADTKAVVGVFIAGPETDFDAEGGLAAQGTIVNGWPSAIATPAAQTSETTTLIGS